MTLRRKDFIKALMISITLHKKIMIKMNRKKILPTAILMIIMGKQIEHFSSPIQTQNKANQTKNFVELKVFNNT